MTALFYLIQLIHSVGLINVPAGSQLQIRMQTPVASWSIRAGMPINAVLIAPVMVDGKAAIPAGSTLSGKVASVTRVGLGVRHERASLGLEFTSLTLPAGGIFEIAARVAQVDNGREGVSSSGLIQGVRATSSISYRVSGYIKMALMWHFHAELAEWAIRSLVVQLPEPEIIYPAGTELTLDLLRPLRSTAPPEPDETLTAFDLLELDGLLASMPVRTTDPESDRSSDLTNVLLVGSRGQIADAFRRAGWDSAPPISIRSRIGFIRAAAEVRGYTAPMTSLLLNGAPADMYWQKGLNDVSKRHHIRVWKQPGQFHGQDVWLAAATRDINFAYLRGHRAFTHRIDPNVDEERKKVTYDLAFTTCASPVASIERPAVARSAQNGTGDFYATDTRVSVIQLNACSAARPAARPPDAPDSEPLMTRGNRWQRLLRREILMARSDLLRANPYWRIFEAGRMALACARKRGPETSAPPPEPSQRQTISLALSSLL